jgi:hypothetical protein
MGHTVEIPSGCSRHLTAYDDTISGDEDFLDVEPTVSPSVAPYRRGRYTSTKLVRGSKLGSASGQRTSAK